MPGQDVELVEHDRAVRVDRDRVAQRHRVEPADAPRPAGRRCRTRGRAPRCPCRSRRAARSGTARSPTRVEYAFITPMTSSTWSGPMPPPVHAPPATGFDERHERVGAVVEVEQRALGALEQDVVAAPRARPGRATSCRRGAARSRSPQATACSTSASTVEAPRRPSTSSSRFLSGSARADALAQDARGRAGPPSGARAARRGRRTPARCRAPSCRPSRRRAGPRWPGRAPRGTA